MSTTEHEEITDLMYSAYGTDTGILFGIPANLRKSVEVIVKTAIRDFQSRIDRLEAEKAKLVKTLDFYADEAFYGELSICTPETRAQQTPASQRYGSIVPIILDDRGKRARAALSKHSSVPEKGGEVRDDGTD